MGFNSCDHLVFDKQMILDTTDIEFAGHKFLILKEYDAFLKAVYGDYMTLPPLECRVSNHALEAYWKEKN